jgi:diguanylate cyclase
MMPLSALAGREFDREHGLVLTDMLAKMVEGLQTANARLLALADLNLDLASERVPELLLRKACHGARSLIGAKYAVLALTERIGADHSFFTTSGVQFSGAPIPPPLPQIDVGPLGRVFSSRRSWRARVEGAPRAAVLPTGYPEARAYLAAPISSAVRTYGWICLADSRGADGFTPEEETVLSILAAQVGRLYESRALTQGIEASEERFRQLTENIQDVLLFITSADYREVIYVSPTFEQIWGRRLESPKLESWIEWVHVEDRAKLLDRLLSIAGKAVNEEVEFRIVQPGGAIRWILSRHFAVRDELGRPYRVVGVATDVTERKQADARIKHLNRVYGLLSALNALSVRARSQDGLFGEACELAVRQGDYQLAWIGRLKDGEDVVTPVAWAGDGMIASRPPQDVETIPIDADVLLSAAIRRREPSVCNDLEASAGPVSMHRELLARGLRALVALPLVIHDSPVGCLVLGKDLRGAFDAAEMRLLGQLAEDISFALDHLEKVEKLNHLAYHDSLTGLPNRALFLDRLAEHVAAAARDHSKFALIVADPERFDTINDILGRCQADALLKSIASRLSSCVDDFRSAARIGAGQFAAVLPFAGDDGSAARIVEDLSRAWLEAPFRVNGNELPIACLVGVAIYPTDGIPDAEALLKSAETALKRAKATGDRTVFFTRKIHDWNTERLSMETRLRHALENEEFVLHYQPKVDVETRRLEGFEALIRWQSPELGLVPPAKFVPLIEETGMIVEVGAWVLRQASADRLSWIKEGLAVPRIAVNVSTVQLCRANFVEIVRGVIEEAHAAGSAAPARGAGIDIEVTESLLLEGAEVNIERLRAVRDLGVGIAIDDFGTGYSSLGYLAKLPVECVKIDRSFTLSMLDDPSAMTLVSTMITLAHSLKLRVVAEGVESEEQAKFLRLLRCDQMQGYLMSKPLPYREMTVFLRHLQNTEALCWSPQSSDKAAAAASG